jgi:hypothetical protein
LVWWIACCIIACDLCLAVCLNPLRVRVSIRGRGESEGTWALAGAVQVGPVSLSGAAARGVPATVQIQAGAWRLWQRKLRALLRGQPRAKPGQVARATDALERLARGYRAVERWFDPVDAAVFLVGERRRIRVRRLEIDLDFSFDDIMLTGRLLAAIYVLQSVLPPQVVIRQRHSWQSVDRMEGGLQGEVEVWPVLGAIDVLYYAMRNIRVAARRRAASTKTEST